MLLRAKYDPVPLALDNLAKVCGVTGAPRPQKSHGNTRQPFFRRDVFCIFGVTERMAIVASAGRDEISATFEHPLVTMGFSAKAGGVMAASAAVRKTFLVFMSSLGVYAQFQ